MVEILGLTMCNKKECKHSINCYNYQRYMNDMNDMTGMYLPIMNLSIDKVRCMEYEGEEKC